MGRGYSLVCVSSVCGEGVCGCVGVCVWMCGNVLNM